MWHAKPLALNLQPDPWIQLDGRLNAPVGAPQLPTLLNGYPTGAPPNARTRWPSNGTQPPWYVAGVDYKVGVPAGKVLLDWQNIDGSTGSTPIPGVTVSGNTISVADNTTIDGVDFTLHNAGRFNISGANNITVRNSKFSWGSNFMVSIVASSLINSTGNNVVFEYCEFDGGGPTFSATVTATAPTALTVTTINVPVPSWVQNNIDICVYNKTQNTTCYNGANGDNTGTVSSFTASSITFLTGAINPIATNDVLIISGTAHQSTILTHQNPSTSVNGVLTLRWNYFFNFNQHVLELSCDNAATFKLTIKYNLIKDGDSGSAGPGAQGPHLNYLQWGHLNVDNPYCVIQFNTTYQSVEFNNGGEGFQGYCNSGVPAPGGDFSYNTAIYSPLGSGITHLAGGKLWSAYSNYIDKKGNASYLYAEANPSPTGDRYFGNFDLTTGNTVAL